MRNKSEVLAIVTGLFHEHGYHGTTMRAIARALEMRETQIYVTFGSKEDMLWEIIVRMAHLFLAQAHLVSRELLPFEQLQSLITRHLEIVMQERDYVTVFARDWMFLDEERRAEIRAMRASYEAYFYRVIQEGMESGLFRIADAQVACQFVLSALNWIQSGSLSVDVAHQTVFTDQYTSLVCYGFNIENGTSKQLEQK